MKDQVGDEENGKAVDIKPSDAINIAVRCKVCMYCIVSPFVSLSYSCITCKVCVYCCSVQGKTLSLFEIDEYRLKYKSTSIWHIMMGWRWWIRLCNTYLFSVHLLDISIGTISPVSYWLILCMHMRLNQSLMASIVYIYIFFFWWCEPYAIFSNIWHINEAIVQYANAAYWNGSHSRQIQYCSLYLKFRWISLWCVSFLP